MITEIFALTIFALAVAAHHKGERNTPRTWLHSTLAAAAGACVAELASGNPEFLAYALVAAAGVTFLARHLLRQDEERWGRSAQ